MAQLIKSNGEIIDITPINGHDFKLEELQQYVGGLIEVLHMKHRRLMVCNEEGRIYGLPVNHLATKILADDIGNQNILPMLGDIIICEDHQIK